MEKNIEKLEGCWSEIEISLTPEELQPYYEKAYKKAQPEIAIKGFRKGKVPLKVIKQQFGPQIEAEAEEEIVSESFGKAAHEENIHIVGMPQLAGVERPDGGLKFKIRYETLPDFELGDYQNLELDEPVHAVSEEEIDEEIDKLTKHNADFHDAETVENEQYVVGIKMQEVDTESKLPIVGSKTEEAHVYLEDKSVIPELRDKLMGASKGDTIMFNPHDSDEHSPDKLYQVSIEEVQKMVPAEFTNDFVETYSKGKFKTTEELREEIGFRLQEKWDIESRNALENQMIDTLVEMHEFPVPETVREKVMEQMVEDLKKRYEKTPYKDTITLDRMRPDLEPIADRSVKWEIVRNKIIEKEKLEVEDHDIESIIESHYANIKMDKDTMKQSLMKNRQFTDSILIKKVMDLLMDFSTTNEMTFEEFNEKHKEQDHDHEHDHDHDHEH